MLRQSAVRGLGRGRGLIYEHQPPEGLRDVPFRSTGDMVEGAFRCASCGYGVAISRTLPRCPMCGGEDWEDELAGAFVRAQAEI